MSLFEQLITESNEKSDDPATYGAMVDGGEMGADDSKHQSSSKERRCVRRCSTQPAFIVCWRTSKIEKNSSPMQKKNGLWWHKVHRAEWCAAAGKFLCMRCGRSSNKMDNSRKI